MRMFYIGSLRAKIVKGGKALCWEWVIERDSTPENIHAWIRLLQKDEPGKVFSFWEKGTCPPKAPKYVAGQVPPVDYFVPRVPA